jgi:hypothetical protein
MAMAVDLADYTHAVRRHLRKVGACAVIVTAPDKNGPFVLATSTDPLRRLAGSGLSLFHCLWTPGKPVATGIEQDACERLKVFACAEDEGYATDLLTIRIRLDEAARRLYPKTPCLAHEELLAVLPCGRKFPPGRRASAGNAR